MIVGLENEKRAVEAAVRTSEVDRRHRPKKVKQKTGLRNVRGGSRMMFEMTRESLVVQMQEIEGDDQTKEVDF